MIKVFQLAVKLTPTHRQSDRWGRGMAALTVSEKGKQDIFANAEQLYCSSNLTAEIQDQFIALAVLNTLLSIAAFLGNTLILVALRNIHLPNSS